MFSRLGDIFSIAQLFSRILPAALWRALSYPLRSIRAPSLQKDVLYTAIRTMLTHLTIHQARLLNATTTQRYLGICKAQSRTPNTIELEGESGKVMAHWVGDPDADAVILYFHGGSFFQPATSGTFLYLDHLVRTYHGAGSSRTIAALVLAYSLAPEATHPTQLQEAATMLSHLLKSSNRSPSSIFISGDSAGGTVALMLLSHLRHPHPEVTHINLDQPLGGALLYSPFVSFRVDYPSFRRNSTLDMIPESKVRAWAAMLLGKTDPRDPDADPGPISGDAYCEPCLSPSTWWQGMHHIIGHIITLSGGDEVFADSIREFRRRFEQGWTEGGGDISDVLFIETPREAHIGPIVNFMSSGGRGATTPSQRAVEAWYSARMD